ncbi:FAD-binding and (Fe-S)-binding domain-containing protein [Halovivax limisalsi]|uniref:FAD-binding and (Fe-S)-binding domain-containing protein n=1 Tax=Halovivax limisalsi TaxID=1453760 RepID=UPI001FFC3C0A|nr:FAD-binding and (Fe-S)-binding domain-containing protein [Halovivax limisalsi]
MASDRAPADDPRATYDYASDAVERPALATDLSARVDGEVRMDRYTRSLYATDASAYEVTPVGVVFPRSTADVASVVGYCAEREIPVLPRGGGTSLAGQTVNRAVVLDFTRYMDEIRTIDPDDRTATVQPGTLLGTLDERLEPHGLTFAPDPAWGEKSAIGGAIGNNSTGAHSLRYGKTDAYIESCEVVLADGTVTRFGEVTLDELAERADPDGDLEARIYATVDRIIADEGDAIEAAYPDLKRNVSGYNLDRLIAEARGADLPGGESTGPAGTVNLARLLAGSEGTLAIVTEATVSLEPVPETKAVALLCYRDLHDAMADVAPILEHDPAAVEVLDDVLIDLARGTTEFGPVTEMLPEGTNATLLVEFYADGDADRRDAVERLLVDRVPGTGRAASGDEPPDTATESADDSRSGSAGDEPRSHRAIEAIEAYEPADRATLWKLRKSGLPILLSRTTDAKHISFIEDTAVPPSRLPEFVESFEEILETHGTYASFYAHAGPGVLHVRPLVNTKTVEGLDQLRGIADDVTDLVVELGGSVSGEHGDGRARTRWNRKLYGERVYDLFRELKEAFDPDWLLNPGQVVGYPPRDGAGSAIDRASAADTRRSEIDGASTTDGPDPSSGAGETAGDEVETAGEGPSAPPERAGEVSLDEHLRFDPSYSFDPGFEPTLDWPNDNGMQGMIELCHGCGGCRGEQSTTGGVMCPTFRASDEEITSTRGRANALRRAMNGEMPGDVLEDEFVEEVLDLCIGCKGCAVDCPSEVDMAKLKAEVTHQYNRRHGASIRDRLFADVERLAAWGSRLAPLSNLAQRVPGGRWLLERTIGIDASRPLPTFHRETFVDWFEARAAERPDGPEPTVDDGIGADDRPTRTALVLPDTFTNYANPEAGKAAVEVLEAAGVRVGVPTELGDTGRPAFSKGLLDRARERARETVETLEPYVADGWDVVVIEPSDAVMLQSDYRDLLPGAATDAVANATYGICEYVDRFDLDESIAYDAGGEQSLIYHGHCHQKASKRDHHAVAVLRRAGFAVDPLDSGCCGMAGSFGYEAEHASMSDAIAAILFEQVAESGGDRVVAPGASCRTQLETRPGDTDDPPTPIEVIAESMADSARRADVSRGEHER